MEAGSGQAPDLVALGEQVIGILVSTFDYPEPEARQRINLWRARQHDLAGQALEVILPGMTQAEQDAALLKWALEGMFLERDLRDGAARLGLDLAEETPG